MITIKITRQMDPLSAIITYFPPTRDLRSLNKEISLERLGFSSLVRKAMSTLYITMNMFESQAS